MVSTMTFTMGSQWLSEHGRGEMALHGAISRYLGVGFRPHFNAFGVLQPMPKNALIRGSINPKAGYQPHGDSHQITARRDGQSDAPSLQEALRKRRADQGREASTVFRETLGTSSSSCSEGHFPCCTSCNGATSSSSSSSKWWRWWRGTLIQTFDLEHCAAGTAT